MPTTTHATSLVELAKTKQLPRIQHMDAETLGWIKANRPVFENHDPLPVLPKPVQDVLSAITLPASWLLQPNLRDSLHGQRHALRTATYGAYLAASRKLAQQDQITAILTCLIHDCRRLNDQGDEGHGHRTAQWFAEDANKLEVRFDSTISKTVQDQMQIAITLHDVPYANFTDEQKDMYMTAPILTDIVKTADALDRYRLPKLKWWFNDKLVRLVPTTTLKHLAFDLIVVSETEHLAGASNEAAFRTALTTSGVINGIS